MFWVEKDEVLSFMSFKRRFSDDVSRGMSRERVKAFGVKITARPQHIKDLFRQVFPYLSRQYHSFGQVLGRGEKKALSLQVTMPVENYEQVVRLLYRGGQFTA